MGILKSIFARRKQPQQGLANAPDPISHASSSPSQPVTPPVSTSMQRYVELEAELAQSAKATNTHLIHQSQNHPKKPNGFKKFGKKLLWTGIILGIPAGALYVINLPYPMIREPIAKNAPLLLLPSSMAMEDNFKKGQANIEEARQLIESPTSYEDIDRGAVKLQEGKTALEAIPVWYVNDWANYSRGYSYRLGYDWRFTPSGLQAARLKAGQLEAKVFQEQNAQTELVNAENDLALAKSTLQKAANSGDKKVAIQKWQSVVDRLTQISPQTFAGRKAQQIATSATRDLKQIGGFAAGNEKVVSVIGAAGEFAKKAADSGRNPPHSVARWQEIALMWQEAIKRLESVPNSDLSGYSEAQKRLANYRSNLSEVRERLNNEQQSFQAMERANQQLTRLWASLPKDGKDLNRNQAIAGFIAVDNELEKVKNGTTVYLRAQEIKLEVRQQLKLLQKAN